MPIELTCPNCTSLLRVPESARGRLVRCPKCRDPVRVGNGEAERPENVFERIAERPAARMEGRRDLRHEDDPPAVGKRRREDKVLDESSEEVFEDIEIVEEPPPKRRKKRRKKKRLLPIPDDEQEREGPAWVW